MGSNGGGERPSIISYNSFLNHVYGGAIPPPPPPAEASATDDDAVTPRDIETAAVPDRPVDASFMTQLRLGVQRRYFTAERPTASPLGGFAF